MAIGVYVARIRLDVAAVLGRSNTTIDHKASPSTGSTSTPTHVQSYSAQLEDVQILVGYTSIMMLSHIAFQARGLGLYRVGLTTHVCCSVCCSAQKRHAWARFPVPRVHAGHSPRMHRRPNHVCTLNLAPYMHMSYLIHWSLRENYFTSNIAWGWAPHDSMETLRLGNSGRL